MFMLVMIMPLPGGFLFCDLLRCQLGTVGGVFVPVRGIERFFQ